MMKKTVMGLFLTEKMCSQKMDISVFIEAVVVLPGLASTACACGLLSGPKLSTRAQIHV